MTALARSKPFTEASGVLIVPQRLFVVKSAVQVYQGGTVAQDPSDSALVKPAAAAKPFYRPIGVAYADLLGNGSASVYASTGLFERENSAAGDEVLATLPLGWPLYSVDDQTVSLTDGGGTRAFCGVFGGLSANSKPLVWIGVDPYGLAGRVFKVPIVVGHADLTEADGSQTISIGPALPGPCRLAGFSIDTLATAFSGGTASAVTVAYGVGADVDAIMAATDIFTGATAPKAGTAGVLGYQYAPLAKADQINVTIAADDDVLDLTAGALVGSVYLQPGS